jgi:hypothetical protein
MNFPESPNLFTPSGIAIIKGICRNIDKLFFTPNEKWCPNLMTNNKNIRRS